MSDTRRGVSNRTEILIRDDYRCAMCRHRYAPSKRHPDRPDGLQVDHVIEVADGGDDSDGNLQTLCVRCHQVKTTASARARIRPTFPARGTVGLACISSGLVWIGFGPIYAGVDAGVIVVGVVIGYVHALIAWRHRTAAAAARRAARDGRTDTVAAVPAEAQLSSLETALTAFTRGPVTVQQTPDRITVSYPASFRDDSDDAIAGLVDVVHAKVGGRWAAAWDTVSSRVTLTRRPSMPDRIDRPRNPGSSTGIPFATGEDGEVVVWRPDRTPHMLVSGDTGSGKSVLLRGVATTCHEAGWAVSCVDPKRIELSPLRSLGIPVATTDDDMIVAVEAAHAEMQDRYAAIEAGTPAAELQPYLLIVDEAMIWVQAMNSVWNNGGGKQAVKGTGTSHPVVQQWQQIAILGRSARVFLLTGIQRPDAALLGKDGGGATRDQYGVRVAMGPMKPDGLRMLFGRSDIGRDVPVERKGRATVAVGNAGQPFEAQVWFTP